MAEEVAPALVIGLTGGCIQQEARQLRPHGQAAQARQVPDEQDVGFFRARLRGTLLLLILLATH